MEDFKHKVRDSVRRRLLAAIAGKQFPYPGGADSITVEVPSLAALAASRRGIVGMARYVVDGRVYSIQATLYIYTEGFFDVKIEPIIGFCPLSSARTVKYAAAKLRGVARSMGLKQA